MTKRTRRGRSALAHATGPVQSPSSLFCLEFVLDETGSMSSIRRQTVAGFNEFLREQQSAEGSARMTLTKFEGGSLRTPYQDVDLSFIPAMTTQSYVPGGGTNLFDAVGERIETLAERLQSWNVQPDALLVVMTDGGDTCSKYFNAQMISNLVARYRNLGWGFAYLGSDANALRIGQTMGFNSGEIRCFENTNIEETFRDLATATTVYRAAKAAGTTATMFR